MIGTQPVSDFQICASENLSLRQEKENRKAVPFATISESVGS